MSRTHQGTTASRPVLDLAALGQDFAADPYPTYARLRAEGPAHRVRTPEGDEVWLVVGYDTARAVLADPRFGKDWRHSATPPTEAEAALSHNMLESDPPRHTRLRKLVAREFTMRRVELLRPRVAGHETTVNLIGNGMHALLSHPDQLAALRADLTLLDGAVEEMLRYGGPVESATYRFPVEPVELDGTVVPAGETVLVVLADAHRTAERFPDPHRFDIRRDTAGHLAFGHGIHFCVGAPLARMEARIAVRALLERCPDLALDVSPGELVWYPNPMIRGLEALPVRWRRGREAGRRTRRTGPAHRPSRPDVPVEPARRP